MASIVVPKLADAFKEKLIDRLAKEGQEIIDRMYSTHETKRDTGNQENAYGWGVYYQGKLQKLGISPSPKARGRIKIHGTFYSGREEITKFLKTLKVEQPGFYLVLANAMFYSSFHENGYTPTGRVYRIISQMGVDLSASGSKIASDFRFDPKKIERYSWTRTANI